MTNWETVGDSKGKTSGFIKTPQMEAKRNEERKASELHNLPLYMSPTKKCYANEE